MKFKTNKSTIFYLAAGIFLAAMISSCTKNFESINKDPYGLWEDDLKGDYKLYGAPFTQIQYSAYFKATWQYQLQQDLNADIYSGYMMSQSYYANGLNNTNYFMVDGWNNTVWSIAYSDVMAPVKDVLEKARKDNYPNFEAWALILRVLFMHRICDVYGPIIYTHYGSINSDGSVTYDSQQDAYKAFFSDLDSAEVKLKPYVDDPSAPQAFKNFDLAYGGDYSKWMKLLNALRLRLALRIVYADATTAKSEATKALTSTYGLPATNGEDFIINSKSISNPLNVITNDWANICMGAPMESFLVGYSDPRLSTYFVTCTDPDAAGQYKGIRNGIDVSGDKYNRFSRLGALGTKAPMFSAAEVAFMKAEAKLRWSDIAISGGTVKDLYEAGILLSLNQWGVGTGFSTYKESTATPIPWIDPKNSSNSVLAGNPNLSTVSPKFNDAGSFEQQLEQIITQKWIATYPESMNAWAEFRRTGYPKLFPVVINNSGGAVPNGQFIKRLPFSTDEKTTNQAGYTDAVQKLGGNDNCGTKVWWDKK